MLLVYIALVEMNLFVSLPILEASIRSSCFFKLVAFFSFSPLPFSCFPPDAYALLLHALYHTVSIHGAGIRLGGLRI